MGKIAATAKRYAKYVKNFLKKDQNKPIGKMTQIEDFLPPPENLTTSERTEK